MSEVILKQTIISLDTQTNNHYIGYSQTIISLDTQTNNHFIGYLWVCKQSVCSRIATLSCFYRNFLWLISHVQLQPNQLTTPSTDGYPRGQITEVDICSISWRCAIIERSLMSDYGLSPSYGDLIIKHLSRKQANTNYSILQKWIIKRHKSALISLMCSCLQYDAENPLWRHSSLLFMSGKQKQWMLWIFVNFCEFLVDILKWVKN